MEAHRIFTASRLELDRKRWGNLGGQGRERVDKWGYLYYIGTSWEYGTIQVKDMVLKQAIEQRRVDTGRVTENLG